MNLRISVLMTTFRWGGLDLFLSSLAKQTFQEPWEIVLVDELHDDRADDVADYAADIQLASPLKHVPAPEPREGTVSNYSRSLNEGLVHCDGECVVFEMDYTYLEATALERFWRLHLTFPDSVVSGLAHPFPWHEAHDIVEPEGPITLFAEPVEEVHPDKMTVYGDDRFRPGMGLVEMKMLSLMDDQKLYEYGYTVSPHYIVPLEWLLDINGWDEAYDEGGHGFDDLDLMHRLRYGAGATFLIDTYPGSNGYVMQHPWSKMPEEDPNPNRQRHIRRAMAIGMGMEGPWVNNDRVLRRARMERLRDEADDALVRHFIGTLLKKDVVLKERNPTQLARLGWVLDQAEGTVLELGAREGQYPERDGWTRLDVQRTDGQKPHVLGDGQRLPFRYESFDTVLVAETLEHVMDPRQLLQEALRVARNKVVVTTPNEWKWHESFRPFAPDFKQHRRYYTEASFLEEVLGVCEDVCEDFHILDLNYKGFAFLLAQLFKERPKVRVRASVAGIRLLPPTKP